MVNNLFSVVYVQSYFAFTETKHFPTWHSPYVLDPQQPAFPSKMVETSGNCSLNTRLRKEEARLGKALLGRTVYIFLSNPMFITAIYSE